MPDYSNFNEVNKLLDDAQSAESDNRERVRIVRDFLDKDDGQWEPDIAQKMTNRPRYTFDKCNPIVDSIAGEMEQADFAIRTRPSAGDASKEVADIYNGLIRNIESMSGAIDIYNSASRNMVKGGFDAWMVKHDFIDADSFEQDLFIKRISNSVDRVWFDENAEEPDASDAAHCFLLHTMTKQRYTEQFGEEASCQSVSNARTREVYSYKPNFIVIGQIFFKKSVQRELVLMSDQTVLEVNEDFDQIKAQLAERGVTPTERTRKREKIVVHSRFFDGSGWLGDEKATVFSFLPVIPIYGNFDIAEDKIIYRGAINKLMDAQRVYNYAQSRSVEEGALAPREKHWMTNEQAAGHQDKLRTFNTNADPVQLYNHVQDQPQPYKTGGPSVNQGLQVTASDMKQNIVEGSGIFAANQGDAPNQSGIAIELQQNKGDNSTIKYFKARERAIRHTAKIICDAIPRVYDTARTLRVIGEDGATKMVEVNQAQAGEGVKITNDLRTGKYDVICDVGPAFKNRQQETKQAFIDVATIDPSILQQGKDVFLKSLNSPGMDAMAERARKQLFEGGMIPDSQMTDEEKERAQQMIEQAQAEQAAAAQQPPSPIEQAMIDDAQANVADTQSRIDERLAKIQTAQRKQDLEEAKFEQQSSNDVMQLILQQNMAIVDELKKNAETMKIIREAMGADAIVGPGAIDNFKQQSDIVGESQQQQS